MAIATAGVVVMVSCGGSGAQSATQDAGVSVPAAQDTVRVWTVPETARVWVIDGRVLAVRRGPSHPTGYGAHGVDYAPDAASP
jgi:hypothetical protein